MGEFDDIMDKLSNEDSERLLEIARFAELGMSASAVIHELRQPLTALSMALQMALASAREGDVDEIEKSITEAVHLSTKADMLLQRARDFMRPSSGMSHFDVEESLIRVMSVFQWQTNEQTNYELKYIVDEGPLTIYGDKAQIEQMIANLVSNGMDAIREKGEGKVHVLARRKDDRQVEIVVADNGPGIKSDIEQNMFDPFRTTKGASKGTGLGLYIVSKVASRHGAGISFLRSTELRELGFGEMNTGFSILFKEKV